MPIAKIRAKISIAKIALRWPILVRQAVYPADATNSKMIESIFEVSFDFLYVHMNYNFTSYVQISFAED